MCNDILWSMEKQQITLMAIFDLSVAFDTVDQNILLNILQNHYGITDKALQWFKNYLQSWDFKVSIRNKYSRLQQLHFSVPKGLCSAANLFTCYSALIDKVVPEDIIIEGFPDDLSLRKSFPALDTQKEKHTKEKLEATFATIKSWIDQMRLKLNADKTEYITFGSRIQLQKVSSSPLITGNDVIQMSSNVKYLGGILDSKLNFNKHITMQVKKAIVNFIHIRAI